MASMMPYSCEGGLSLSANVPHCSAADGEGCMQEQSCGACMVLAYMHVACVVLSATLYSLQCSMYTADKGNSDHWMPSLFAVSSIIYLAAEPCCLQMLRSCMYASHSAKARDETSDSIDDQILVLQVLLPKLLHGLRNVQACSHTRSIFVHCKSEHPKECQSYMRPGHPAPGTGSRLEPEKVAVDLAMPLWACSICGAMTSGKGLS